MRTTFRPFARSDAIDQLGWTYSSDGAYGAITYRKTAMAMKTLEGYLGPELMAQVMRDYYERWRFRHPKPDDFFASVVDTVEKAGGKRAGGLQVTADELREYFQQAFRSTRVLDYAVAEVESRPHRAPRGVFDEPGKPRQTIDDTPEEKGPKARHDSRVLLRRRGDFVFPVEVEVRFADGSTRLERWDGRAPWKRFEYEAQPRVIGARLDPERKVWLDVDWQNNERAARPSRRGPLLLAARALFWVQSLVGLGGF
jgi:hypothetical protein